MSAVSSVPSLWKSADYMRTCQKTFDEFTGDTDPVVVGEKKVDICNNRHTYHGKQQQMNTVVDERNKLINSVDHVWPIESLNGGETNL